MSIGVSKVLDWPEVFDNVEDCTLIEYVEVGIEKAHS